MTVRLLVLADVHSNLPALRSALADAQTKSPDYVIFAGDLVGYYPWPNEVTELLKDELDFAVMGNHDYSAITGDFNGYNPVAQEADEMNARVLEEKTRSFLRSLNARAHFEIAGFSLDLVHGSPRDPLFEYVYPEDLGEFEFRSDVVLLGHTHVQFAKKVGKTLVLNPGSVGQPRDGDPRLAYALLELGTEPKASLFRAKYDIEATAKKVLEAGYPLALAQRLFYGL